MSVFSLEGIINSDELYYHKKIFDQKAQYKGNFRKSALRRKSDVDKDGMDGMQPTMLIKFAPNYNPPPPQYNPEVPRSRQFV